MWFNPRPSFRLLCYISYVCQPMIKWYSLMRYTPIEKYFFRLLFEQIQKHLKLRNWVLRNIQWCLQLLDIWTLNLCISFAMNHSNYFFLCLLCLISYQQGLPADFYTPKIKLSFWSILRRIFWVFSRNWPFLNIFN